jgi:hypothetical protein
MLSVIALSLPPDDNSAPSFYKMSWIRGLFLFLHLAPALVVSGATTRNSRFAGAPNSTVKRPPLKRQLDHRGGSLLDKVNVARLATTVSIVQGSFCWLFPFRTCLTYGLEASPLQEFIMRRVGVILLQFGVAGFCLFYKNCSIDFSLGVSTIVKILDRCREMLSGGASKTIEFGAKSHFIPLAVDSFISYAALSNQKYTRTVNKAHAVMLLLKGIIWFSVPETVLRGVNAVDVSVVKMVRGLGLWLISFSTFAGGLVLDIEPSRALAYSRVLVFLRTLLVHFVGNTGKFKTQQVLWLTYHAFIAGALLC